MVFFAVFFFCLFSIRSYVFPNNLVFKKCLYANHFYVLFFSDIYIFKILLVFQKSKNLKIDCK